MERCLHYNVPSYILAIGKATIAKVGFGPVEHLPYPPDLDPSDYRRRISSNDRKRNKLYEQKQHTCLYRFSTHDSRLSCTENEFIGNNSLLAKWIYWIRPPLPQLQLRRKYFLSGISQRSTDLNWKINFTYTVNVSTRIGTDICHAKLPLLCSGCQMDAVIWLSSDPNARKLSLIYVFYSTW